MLLNYSEYTPYHDYDDMNGCMCLLNEAYENDCKQIAADVAAEGYPSHGENYEIRCEDHWLHVYAWEYEEVENEANEYLSRG